MGRPKGGKNRKYTKEEKLKFVLMCENDGYPVRSLARDSGIALSNIKRWIDQYRKGGPEALNPIIQRRGNRFAALHNSKNLSEEDRLRLMVEKLTVENERLKKGYVVKGVGAGKEFVTLRELNSR